jgi:phage FluMu protein Com
VKDVRRVPPTERELRCGCGSLMARLTPSGIELKCRRCKRLVVVPVSEERGKWVEVPVR